MEANEYRSSVSNNNTSATISNLPWEVLQEIFLHLNGKSLVVCKRVCKSWKDHINYLEQKHTFWYDRCQREIPTWVQIDILDNVYPAHWKNQSCVDWGVIFKCWHTFSTLKNITPTWTKIVSGLNGISCMKISGKWLLVSTCDGGGKNLGAYSLLGDDYVEIFVGPNPILSFELVNSDEQCPSNIKPHKKREEVFSTLDHNEIWLELKEYYIQLRENYILFVDKLKKKIRHSYGYEVSLVSDRRNSVLNFNKTCKEVNGAEIIEIEMPYQCSEIVDFWSNRVTVCERRGSGSSRIITVNVNMKSMHNSLSGSDLRLDSLTEGDCKVYSWHGSLYVAYTRNRHLRFHIDGETEEQMISVKKGCITSVLIYTYYLFLGTDRGKLLIYKLENPQDCLSVFVNETESWNIQIAYSTIIHIAVVEPTHHNGKKPMIVCASPEDIYLISFPDHWFSHPSLPDVLTFPVVDDDDDDDNDDRI